jgi:hypothetical protein
MAAEPLPAPTEAPRELHRELHVVPLLRSYRDAMLLARKPPASLRLWRWLRWIHLRLRPRWACCYFTTRYVRGRVDALERALARRTALGEADADDHEEAVAVTRFKASLPTRALADLRSRRPDRRDRAGSGAYQPAAGPRRPRQRA